MEGQRSRNSVRLAVVAPGYSNSWRDEHVLTLEEAIRKMTSFPAARLGFTDRGVLRPGMKADIAIFDPATVKDTATFTAPHQYAEGIGYVIVNGEAVFSDGKMTGAPDPRFHSAVASVERDGTISLTE